MGIPVSDCWYWRGWRRLRDGSWSRLSHHQPLPNILLLATAVSGSFINAAAHPGILATAVSSSFINAAAHSGILRNLWSSSAVTALSTQPLAQVYFSLEAINFGIQPLSTPSTQLLNQVYYGLEAVDLGALFSCLWQLQPCSWSSLYDSGLTSLSWFPKWKICRQFGRICQYMLYWYNEHLI